MRLSDMVPIQPIETSLGQPVKVERIDGSDWQQLLERRPESFHGIVIFAWHRLVQSGRPKVNPMMMQKYFQEDEPDLAGVVKAIERLAQAALVQGYRLYGSDCAV